MSNSLQLEVDEYDGPGEDASSPEGHIKIEPRENDENGGPKLRGIKDESIEYDAGAREGPLHAGIFNGVDGENGDATVDPISAEAKVENYFSYKADILDEPDCHNSMRETSVHYTAINTNPISETLDIKTEPCDRDFEQYEQDDSVPINLHINTAAIPESIPSKCIAARNIVARMKKDVFGSDQANVAHGKYMMQNNSTQESLFGHAADEQNSATHGKTESSTTTHACPFCGKCFSNSGNLRPHIRTHTGEKPYKCSFCDRGFGHSSHLQRHVQIHTREKTHKCAVCDDSFGTPSELQKHSRSHAEEKPFKCPDCDKSFRRSGHLRSHVLSHTGEKPYKCPTCDKSFNRPGHLNVHIRTHTGEKPYKCPLCDKGFSVSSHLQRHIRTHTGEKPHTCTICGRGFSQSGDCQRHVRTHDKDV